MAREDGRIDSQVITPGFNIEPQYDLVQTRKHLFRSRGKSIPEALPLTSMIDMFSMVVIFLIMNFSSNGDAFYVARGVVLPKARNADLMESYPLVSILQDRIYLDALPADRPKVELEERTKPYPKLRRLLKDFLARETRENPGKKPEMTVNIQADKDTPMFRVREVMKLLVEEGWTGIQLTVRKKYDPQ